MHFCLFRLWYFSKDPVETPVSHTPAHPKCGAGFKAGFSHAPTNDGKERYVFFSFPHIAISSEGKLGAISRPGRSGDSSACGALIAALGQFQSDPAVMEAYAEGKHDANDPEFSILKQRLAARVKQEGLDPKDMTLVDMTSLAERTITADLEGLVKQTVDPNQSDYAVITGVHVHNWANEGTGVPTLEWIAPVCMYIVVDGKRTTINLDVRTPQRSHCVHALFERVAFAVTAIRVCATAVPLRCVCRLSLR